jgi:soluble lytic murein transglycosylase-like protein
MGLGLWSRQAGPIAARPGLASAWHPLWLALVPGLAVAAVSLEHVDHPQWTNKYDKHFKKYAKHYFGPGTDWRWFKAQAIAESNLRPGAKNPSGATGIMQILPSTFREIRQTNPSFASLSEPRWNIAAGIYYDRYLYKRWLKRVGRLDDHLDYTFASYNAGFGRISKAFRKAGGGDGTPLPWLDVAIHSPGETRNYVIKIRGLMERAGSGTKRAAANDETPAADDTDQDAPTASGDTEPDRA